MGRELQMHLQASALQQYCTNAAILFERSSGRQPAWTARSSKPELKLDIIPGSKIGICMHAWVCIRKNHSLVASL